jgi:hypothetical protein
MPEMQVSVRLRRTARHHALMLPAVEGRVEGFEQRGRRMDGVGAKKRPSAVF